MKKKGALLLGILTIMVLFFAWVFPVTAAENKVTVLFTSDTHSNFLPYKISDNGVVTEAGGFARIKTLINNEKALGSDPLVVDAGDFSMGTLFQTLFQTDASELRMLGNLGYDATTLGNHEFDYRTSGLTDMLNAAVSSGDPLPQLVASNIIFPLDKSGNLTPELADLKTAFNGIGLKDYTIIEKNGVKIGVFGLFGKDAAATAPTAAVDFEDNTTAAKRIVGELKGEGVDMIIALSHSGINPDPSKSEDQILAKNVPDIDLIISGHTHSTLEEPIISGNTMIVAADAYGRYLGKIVLNPDGNGRFMVESYALTPITSNIPSESDALEKINGFKAKVQETFLNQYGYTFDQLIARSPFSFQTLSELTKANAESPLGNLITDAYIHGVKQAEGANYEEIAAAIVPNGVIRSSITQGDLTVSDAFNVSSLGIGKDGIPGYPLVSIYLTGKELKSVAEVDASVTALMSDAQLYTSGLDFTFNPHRLIFNKVTDAHLVTNQGVAKLEDDKLYRVVAGLYSCQMLGAVQAQTFGIISLVPKDKNGNPVTNFEDYIIYNNGSEVKEWITLATYISSFDKKEGVSVIPDYYNETHERKNVDDNNSLGAILNNPNEFAIMVYGLISIVILTILYIIIRIATRKKRKLKKQARLSEIEAQKKEE